MLSIRFIREIYTLGISVLKKLHKQKTMANIFVIGFDDIKSIS